jgi:hypothetical protein
MPALIASLMLLRSPRKRRLVAVSPSDMKLRHLIAEMNLFPANVNLYR